MATTAERFHIVLNPAEKRRWTERAKAAGLPTSEYVRRAVEAFGSDDHVTPEEMAELEVLASELDRVATNMHDTLDGLFAQLDSFPAWEKDMQRRVADRLKCEPVQLDPAVLDFGQADMETRDAA